MSGEAAFACRTGVWSPVTQKKKKLCQDKLVARYQRFSFVFSLFFCTGLSPKFVSPFARRALFSHLQRGWKKKKKEGYQKRFLGILQSCFSRLFQLCVTLLSQFTLLLFVSLRSGHDLIITTPSRFMYNMHNILPYPVLHPPTTTSSFFVQSCPLQF